MTRVSGPNAPAMDPNPALFEGMHPATGLSESPSVREVHWAALWGAQPSSLMKIKADRLAG